MRNFIKTALLMMIVVQANVPFPFVVNGRTLPAGKYAVERNMTTPSALMIRAQHGRDAAVVLTTPDGGTDPAGTKPALTFQRYENQYRLSGVWDVNGNGRDIVQR